MNIVLSPAAQTDLEDIWLYSAEQWGRQQTNSYLAKLRAAIAKSPKRPGKPCGYIRPGYWRLNCGSHVILYLRGETELDIKRVLHQSMDFTRHL